MSGHGTGCWRHGCPVLTDDPGLVFNKVKVVTVPTQPAFPGRELSVGNESGGTRGEGAGALRDSGDFHFVHPCRVNLFEKPCPRLRTTWERTIRS